MNTALQRWVSADPLEIHSAGEADTNLYAYVSGQALKDVDPLGLYAAPPHPLAVTFVVLRGVWKGGSALIDMQARRGQESQKEEATADIAEINKTSQEDTARRTRWIREVTKRLLIERQKRFSEEGGVGLADPGAYVWYRQRFGSREAALYQAQISRTVVSLADKKQKTWDVAEYLLNGVRFDGIDHERKVFLEAKANYSKFWDGKKPEFLGAKLKKQLIGEAERQLVAVGKSKEYEGYGIEWHFNEEYAAQQAREVLDEAGIEGITVRYTPQETGTKHETK